MTQVHTTLVRPILEYASIIWDPHTTSNIHKLETVQRRSARHIMHNYNRHASVTTMLQHLDLPIIHSEYSTLNPALCPHTCIQNIFLPQHHQNMEQPTTCHSTTTPQLRQALQSTPTSGRRGAPCSAGSEWTPHAYWHHLLHMYNQIAIQLQNIKSYNQSPTLNSNLVSSPSHHNHSVALTSYLF